jgi:hypothetical protein
LRNPERSQELLNVNNFLFFAKEDQVNRKHHANGVDSARRDYPKTAPETSPAFRLSEKSDQTSQIAVCHTGFRSNESLSCLVIDIE